MWLLATRQRFFQTKAGPQISKSSFPAGLWRFCTPIQLALAWHEGERFVLSLRAVSQNCAPNGQTGQEGDNAMTANTTVRELLLAPLAAEWIIDGLADQVLHAIAASDDHELVLDADALSDRQARRLLRPLLACLAKRSAAPTGMPINLFRGSLTLATQGPAGPLYFAGEFDNRAGSERLVLRSIDSHAETSGAPRQSSAQKSELA